MTIEEKIKEQLLQKNLDIRQSAYRFMDQKVTPDILSFISDCATNLPLGKNQYFTKNDIWHSGYFSKNVVMIYNKPDADNETVAHEYDKICAQPLKTLSFAGVLTEEQSGKENKYYISNQELLEYISLSAKNAFNFLRIYLQEVMEQSGFIKDINQYLEYYEKGESDSKGYVVLKSHFESFMLGNTKINNRTEIRRIFPKVINIFAVTHGVPGSKKGVISDGPYLFSDLMYNKTNFRDLRKTKNVSRQENQLLQKKSQDYSNYEMRKIMDSVKKHHYPNSEVRDNLAVGEATQVHHIFPVSEYPHLKSTPENLILLTAQQHNAKAHPSNKTSVTDPEYQIVCLLSKLESVRNSVIDRDGYYSKEGYIALLNSALKLNIAKDASFEDIAHRLRQLLQQN